MSSSTAWGLYTIFMLTYLLRAVRSGFLEMRDSFRLFYQDALGNTSTERSLGQQFALEVFGEPQAPDWVRYGYAISAALAYPVFALFLVMEGLFNRSAAPVGVGFVICFVLGLLLNVATVSLSVWFIFGYGSVESRVRAFFDKNPPRAESHTRRSQKPSGDDIPDLPWWWLYTITRREIPWRILRWVPRVWFVFASLLGVIFGLLALLHAFNGEDSLLAWVVLALWLPTGWLYPLDGALKVAPWRGNGNFSALVLRAALYEKTQQEKSTDIIVRARD